MDAKTRTLLAVAAILPAAGIGLYFLAGDIVLLLDPCHTWGDASATTTIAPGDPCQGRSASSQTLGSYLLMMLAIKGGIALGCVLGGVGIVRADRKLALAGAIVLALVGVPLMLGGTGLIVWASAGLVGAMAFVR